MAQALTRSRPADLGRRRLPPYAALLLVGLIWGSSFLFIRIAVVDLGPRVLVFGRSAAAAAALAVFFAVRGRSPLSGAHWRRLPSYLAMALLNSVIPWLGIAFGELAVSSGLASIFNATTPLWTALLAWSLTPAERPSPVNYVGVLVGFGGTVLVILPRLQDGQARATLVGAASILLAALSYALAALYQRRRLRDVDPFDAAFWQMALTALVMLPIAMPGIESVHLSWAALLAVLAMGIGASCVGIVLYYWLLNRLGAAGASTVNYLLPATALLWGVLFLHETVTPLMLGGAAIILCGVLLTSLPRNSHA